MKKALFCFLLVFVMLIAEISFFSFSAIADVLDSSEHELTMGQINTVLRARQVYEIEWTPLRDVIRWRRDGVFRAGETVRGLPYGMPTDANYVPFGTSLSDFLVAVDDIDSNFYSSISRRTGAAPYLSLDCSAFISWAWELDGIYKTWGLPVVSTNLGTDIRKIQVGDALNYPAVHVVLVTEVRYDDNGDISTIGLMELDPPQAKFTLYGEGGEFPLSQVRSRYLSNGYSIIRYKDIENVTYLHDCVVPLDDDYCFSCFTFCDDIVLPSFIDLHHKSRHRDAVDFTIMLGGFNGTGRNSVTFDFNMTRGIFFMLVSLNADADLEFYSESVFEDVFIDEWYARAIAWAVDIGLIDVTGDRFFPREIISNEEMLEVMLRYLDWQRSTSQRPAPLVFIQ
ncbi:MAG: hypothetical protein LBD23_19410 [Oscillospiraceae bacterium]|nr:hypothetical protein [Oscillospiraceae bacterium]